MYGRTFPQSRHIAAYSTSPGLKLKYSGTEIDMLYPFPPALAEMQERLEKELGVKFNHCMLNRYDDGGVYIGYVSLLLAIEGFG
jgi:alkylated DNA repair dioxygenase AlkB